MKQLKLDLKKWWDDVYEAEKTGEHNDYYGNLKDEYAEQLKSESLKQLTKNEMQALRFCVINNNVNVKDNEVWIQDFSWTYEQMTDYINFYRKHNIDTIYYTNKSSGALFDICNMIKLGCTIVGVNTICEYNEGLTIKVN